MNDRSTDEHIDDAALMQTAKGLALEVSPRRDLWPEIETAITTPVTTARRWTPMFAQAAAVVLLIGASSSVTYVAMKDQQTTGTEVVNSTMLFEQTSFANRYELGSGFQAARDSLIAELDAELQKLPPEARLTIESNLKIIHDSILAMNAALEADPSNTLLQERVLRSYRDELDLIRRVSGLTRNVMMRNDI